MATIGAFTKDGAGNYNGAFVDFRLSPTQLVREAAPGSPLPFWRTSCSDPLGDVAVVPSWVE